MKTLSLFFRCWFLIVLLALFGATVPSLAAFGCNISPVSSFATFTYDRHNQITNGYDDIDEPCPVYKSALVSAGGKMASGMTIGEFLPNIAASVAAEGTVALDANAIRFSQSNVRSSLPQLTESMKANGWSGAPIDVVRMPDGLLTAVDNTRLAAAKLTGTPVQAVMRDFGEAFPAARAGGNLQGGTWGEAVLNRIGGQKPGWQRLYPNGSPFTGVHPTTPGFSP
jgi:filamentous hemagglutinin